MESHFPQSSESIETTATVYGEFVVGQSPSMRSVEAVMREVAQSEVPVLLLAENGAGKKATARRIHELSRRRGQNLHLLSCLNVKAVALGNPAIHEVFEGRGTVFLAEIAELSARDQA